MSTEVTLRYRMSDRDVFYGGGVVNGARSITLMEDTANRLMTKVYGNQSRCAKVRKVFRKLKLEIRKYIKHCKRTADSPFPANVMTVTDRADARHQVC